MSAIYKGLKYEFCAGDGDSGNHLFILKTKSGLFGSSAYTQLRLAKPLDYESMQSPVVTIRVRVTDSRNRTFEKKIALNVLDVLERPENLEVDIVMLGAGGGGGGFDAADDGFDRLSESSTWLVLSGLAAPSRGFSGEDAESLVIAA